ncbi:MAG: 6-pyruvoyl-tetrahydropterin synthase-related protein [Terriglobales bacterium]
MLRNPIARALLLAGACLVAIVPFFWWGNPSGHDFEFHVNSWMEVLGQWKQGIVYPRWAALAHWGYGEARFLFYPPASWSLGAALGAVLPWKMVPGAYCWIALMLAGAAMYRLAREWLAEPSAMFAAIFYALNPYHLLIVYWRSAYAELLASALLPLLLVCLLQIFSPKSEPGWRPTLALSLLLAAAWLTNIPAAVMIYYSTAVLALFYVVRAAVHDKSWSPRLWRPLVRTALAILLGAGLAAFYLLPIIYEQKWIDVSQVLSPGVRPQDNFLFTILADPDHNRFNLLVSTVALAEIAVLVLAIWGSRRSRAKPAETTDNIPWILLTAWGAVSAFLMLSVSHLLWQYLPELRFVQLPFRWLLTMNAALAMLLAIATERWNRNWARTSRLLASAVLLAVLIIAGHRIQPPWWETAADIREMSDAVDDGSGYEGTDEYVPAGVDPYELNKELPRVSDATGATLPNEMLAWDATEKQFTVHAAVAQNLTVRLLSYPAWEVVVNGKPTATGKTDVTGLIVVPIAAGDNDIRIHFRRTIDRVVGNIVSLISLGVFVAAWTKMKMKANPKMKSSPRRR